MFLENFLSLLLSVPVHPIMYLAVVLESREPGGMGCQEHLEISKETCRALHGQAEPLGFVQAAE